MDTRLFLIVNKFARHTSFLHGFAKIYAVYAGIVILCVILATAYLVGLFGRNRLNDSTNAFLTGVSVLIALGIGQIIAHIVQRPRPWQSLKNIELLVGRAHDYSFPSDHATFAGAIIAGLFLSRRYWFALIALIVGLLLGFFRVYVGTHYPGDILGGLALGFVSAWLVFVLIKKPTLFIFEKLLNTPLKLFFIGKNDN